MEVAGWRVVWGAAHRAALLSGGKRREKGREDEAGLARRARCGEPFLLPPVAGHAIRPPGAITQAVLINLYSFFT